MSAPDNQNELTQRILTHVIPSAKDHPMVFLQLMVERAVKERGADAIPQFAWAIEDMANWYQAQADALEAEGRRRGMNITPLRKD
jgi:hypothetical protein